MGFGQISSPHKLDEHPSLNIDMSLPSTWAYCMVKLTCIKNEIQITTKFLHKPSQCLLENYFNLKTSLPVICFSSVNTHISNIWKA